MGVLPKGWKDFTSGYHVARYRGEGHDRGQAMQPATHVSVTIARNAAAAYALLAAPETFLKWASGLAASMKKDGEEWIAQTPEGPAKVRFSELNAYGVLDHWVDFPSGNTVHIPLRVLPNGDGCELVLTVFRRPGRSDADFAADAQWVMRDLQAAKALLERQLPR
jgi:hypothetical protein